MLLDKDNDCITNLLSRILYRYTIGFLTILLHWFFLIFIWSKQVHPIFKRNLMSVPTWRKKQEWISNSTNKEQNCRHKWVRRKRRNKIKWNVTKQPAAERFETFDQPTCCENNRAQSSYKPWEFSSAFFWFYSLRRLTWDIITKGRKSNLGVASEGTSGTSKKNHRFRIYGGIRYAKMPGCVRIITGVLM